MPTYTQNTLAVISNLASGSLKCYLYIDDAISPSLTVPTRVNITNISPVKEMVDLKACEVDLDSVTLEIVDDYSTYTQGFWWKLIEDNPTKDIQIMLILTENAVDTYLFRGFIFRENVNWSEPYISGSTYVRSVSIQLVSPMLNLKNISLNAFTFYLADTHPEMLIEGHDDSFDDSFDYVTIANIFNVMVELAFGASGDGYQLEVRGADLMFWDGNTSAYVNPFTLYLMVQTHVTPVGQAFFATTDAVAWNGRYNNCFEIMTAICMSLGVVPRYYFGDANGVYQGSASDKHTIEILCRGDKTSTVITNTQIIESGAISHSPQKYLNINVKDLASVSTQQYWAFNGTLNSGAPPQNIEFDLTINQEFSSDTATSRGQIYYKYVPGGGGNHFAACIKMEYYNHTTNGWVVVNFGALVNGILEALTKYLYYRFSSGRREYNRSYSTITWGKSGYTSSHQHLRILARHEIDSVAHYAVDIEKDVMSNRSKIKWIQE